MGVGVAAAPKPHITIVSSYGGAPNIICPPFWAQQFRQIGSAGPLLGFAVRQSSNEVWSAFALGVETSVEASVVMLRVMSPASRAVRETLRADPVVIVIPLTGQGGTDRRHLGSKG